MSAMRLLRTTERSITWTTFSMKAIGIWVATNNVEQLRRNIAFGHTIWAVFLASCIAIRDMYFSWGNFGNCIYIFCNVLYLTNVILKITILCVNKRRFFDLVFSLERCFVRASDDRDEQKIVTDNKLFSDLFIVCVTFCAQGTCIGYVITPLMENAGKNKSDRVLPFNLWVDFPVSISPYYEILFAIQILCVYHVATSYLTYDNFLCLICLNIISQFRILRLRLVRLNNLLEKEISNEDSDSRMTAFAIKYRAKLIKCIQHHQTLFHICRKVESVYNLIILTEIMFLAMLMCIVGYQIFILVAPPARRISLIISMLGAWCELLMLTVCLDGLISHSLSVGEAVFSGPWHLLPMNKIGRALRRDVIMIIMRSNKFCCLTAGGFFTVCLETCTGVLSTAMSYFTLLRQTAPEMVNTE